MFPFETMSAKMLDDYVGRKDALIKGTEKV